jgi:hypothetical protein
MKWVATADFEGRTVLRLGRQGELLVAEWPGIASFTVHRDGSSPDLRISNGAPPEMIERIQTNAITAFMRHLRGDLTLHAAAASKGDGAVACVGTSGAGKSTAIHALCQRPTFELLSDDMLFCDGPLAHPSERQCRVDNARSLNAASTPATVKAIVRLSFAEVDRPVLKPVRGALAVAIVLDSIVRFVVDEPEVNRRDMQSIANVVDVVPVFDLVRPRSLERIGESIDILEKLV